MYNVFSANADAPAPLGAEDTNFLCLAFRLSPQLYFLLSFYCIVIREVFAASLQAGVLALAGSAASYFCFALNNLYLETSLCVRGALRRDNVNVCPNSLPRVA